MYFSYKHTCMFYVGNMTKISKCKLIHVVQNANLVRIAARDHKEEIIVVTTRKDSSRDSGKETSGNKDGGQHGAIKGESGSCTLTPMSTLTMILALTTMLIPI